MVTGLSFNYSIATNKGVRPINEDASWIGFNKCKQCLIVVCDGIGSQDDSQVASLITVEVFRKQFEKRSKIFNIDRFFSKCLKYSHNMVTKTSNEKLYGKKIGTTLVVTFIDGRKVTTFNLGDSRLYRYSLLDNTWIQITRDHNLYNYFLELVEKDKTLDINDLCQRHKSQLLSLTKCLESGSTVHLDYDKFVFQIDIGDVLFQATDGVYHFVKLNDVNEVLKNNTNNFDTISRNILNIALNNNSNDNLTAVIVECINDRQNRE